MLTSIQEQYVEARQETKTLAIYLHMYIYIKDNAITFCDSSSG